MSQISRLHTFATMPGIAPDIGLKIDQELNQILNLVNSGLDDVNIDGTPGIQISKLNLAGAGFLATTGGAMSGLLEHLFAGVWRRLGAASGALIREYRDTGAGVLWGLVYNTSYVGPGWAGRDFNDLCWRVEMTTTGQFRYLTAPSAAAGNAPVWRPIQVVPPFGLGPSSVGAASAVSVEGDIIISSGGSLEGLHYYNTLTINTGITVTVTKYVVLIARERITIAGTLNANGQGAAGGDHQASVQAINGRGGTGGGGGSSSGGAAGQKGGDCVVGLHTVAGGAAGTGGSGTPGSPGAALTARVKGALIAAIRDSLHGGAGGGGGFAGSPSNGLGGAGGGVVILIAPTINLASGTISANGATGGTSDTNGGGGGGGGGGLVLIETGAYTAAAALTVAGGAGGALGAGSGGVGGAGGTGLIQINILA